MKPEKNSGLQQGLNPWPRDTGAMLYQLSYEATDVGRRSRNKLIELKRGDGSSGQSEKRSVTT